VTLDCPTTPSLCVDAHPATIPIDLPPGAVLRDGVFLENGTIVMIGGSPGSHGLDDFLLALHPDNSVTPLIPARSSTLTPGIHLSGPAREGHLPALGADRHGTIFGISSGGTTFQLDENGALLDPPGLVDTPYIGAGMAVGNDGQSAYLYGPIAQSFGPGPPGVFALTRGSTVVGPNNALFPPDIQLLSVVSKSRMAMFDSHGALETYDGLTWTPDVLVDPDMKVDVPREINGDATRFVFTSGALFLRGSEPRWEMMPISDDGSLAIPRSVALLPGTRLLMGTRSGATGLWSGDRWCTITTGGISFVRWVSAPSGRQAIGFEVGANNDGRVVRLSLPP
jgi:hypothetical protein